ncbi:MAG: hypothetical protein MUC89_15635 [Acetobacteraceae bacterium]|jgi:hypothetical protein|nr:hypothetical protein [Acetobacteraceae bacterium]
MRWLLAFLFSIPGLVAPATAEAQARLAPEDCRRVTQHVPDPSVTYQPGVGAGGRRVAPADLSPPQTIVPETPVFYLGVDLQRRFGLPRSLEADLPIGIVTVEGNRLLLNGRPLGPEDQSSLAAACAAARRR